MTKLSSATNVERGTVGCWEGGTGIPGDLSMFSPLAEPYFLQLREKVGFNDFQPCPES